jgi:hypothetical protein
MEGTVPGDIAREKQEELQRALETAERQLAGAAQLDHDVQTQVETILTLAFRVPTAYQHAPDGARRDFNQASWEALYLDLEDDRPTVDRSDRQELGQPAAGGDLRGDLHRRDPIVGEHLPETDRPARPGQETAA